MSKKKEESGFFVGYVFVCPTDRAMECRGKPTRFNKLCLPSKNPHKMKEEENLREYFHL